ncbi:meiosis-specific with OB domain-containing protein isoform X2 [Cylas formicarius]|uniref:meiosis-specific with OB domain-containing protein isoform X2 n=1 Tax=Cylas formicarius TaxID=197179 RepID=UPI0029586597|nr:meiosis-specific with OB domain-containing protein isoform X2 [Cylas formicarius]
MMNSSNGNSIGLHRLEIKNLEPDAVNILLVGVIIGKKKPKIFQRESTRAVWNFTLRDSPQHYINVAMWAPPEQVFQANDRFKTGDVVELLNPQVQLRQMGDRSELFHPMVTSPFKLSMSEKSAIVNHPGNSFYLKLLRYPTKPTAAFFPLQDIQNSGRALSGFFVDVLGAVRGLGPIRTVTTKNDETIQVREIEVFDHTCPSLRITLWEPDLIHRSDAWKPRYTILFLTDLTVDWSSFGRAYVAKATGRTIVTENPISKEAESLIDYVKNAPIETFDIVERLLTSLPNTATQEVVNVKQLQERINACVDNEEHQGNRSFSVFLFAFVSHLDLDGLSQTLIVKCVRCKTAMKGAKCENTGCPSVFENEDTTESEVTFDVKVMLSDHTGTLTNCRLSGQAAETVLGCSAAAFHLMSDDQKCDLKWRYLMERCKIRIAVLFMTSQYPTLSILNVSLADGLEVAKKLAVL